MRQLQKLSIFCSLILNIEIIYAQSPINNEIPISITGFGKLQLGIVISNVPELNVIKKSKRIKEIISDTTNLYSNGELDKRVRIFELDKYQLTENVIVNNVTLKFFKDSLYSIKIEDIKMNDLIKTKYGKGNLSLKEEEHTFQNGYGAKFIKTDQTFTTKWIIDKPTILLYSTLLIWYNNQGEKMDLYYVLLEDNIYNAEIEKVSYEVKDRINERLNSKKKLELKGF